MRQWIVWLLIFTLAGCRESLQATPTPDSASARLDLRAEPDPPTSGDGTLMVTVTDAAGQPIDGASVSARGDMTHAGMSPTFGLAAGSTNGVYRIPFAWKMGGDWIVTVTAVLPDGTTLTGEYSFTVEGS